MRILSLLNAFVLSAVPLSGATAATFTPDMWVYEVTFSPGAVLEYDFYAWATAPVGTAVPQGCSGDEISPGILSVDCGTNPGIDLLATAHGGDLRTRREHVTIGFNAGGVVCDGGLWGCGSTPTSPLTSDLSVWLTFDTVLGTLDLCGSIEHGGSYGCVYARPWDVTGFRYDEMSLSGTWAFGFGGTWGDHFITTLSYDVTGRLISAPTPVPLPAGLPLLAVGLVAFGLMRRRRN